MSQFPSSFTESATLTRYSTGSSLKLSSVLVAANKISLVVENQLVEVTFAVSSPATMVALALAIAAVPGVTSAAVNSLDPLRIDLLPNGLSITDIAVTLGASRPTLSPYGGFFNGRYVAGLPSTSTIRVSVQPLGGFELVNLPEAQRTKEQVRLYCETELRTADIPSGAKADIVTLGDNRQYEVHQSAPWSGFGKSFWRVIAARVDSQNT